MTSSEIRNPDGERIDVAFHPGTRHATLVVLGHGVTGNKDRPLIVDLATALAARGWPCLRMSFSGNGNSGGKFEDATITKETDDLRAVLSSVPDYVKVAYIGHSMGAAVGMLVAAEDLRIRTLVSLAGMIHTAEFLDREFGEVTPGGGCMWDEPDCPLSQAFADDMLAHGSLTSTAAEITQPWLLIHGDADDVVPIQDGRDALAAAGSNTEWREIPGAGHSFDGHRDQVAEAVAAWLERTLGTS